MPASDSPSIIVARFLKANNYTESYDAFVSEAGLPSDAGSVAKDDLTLETLLEEKRMYDLSVRFEKVGTGDDDQGGDTGWRVPAPSSGTAYPDLGTSNILSTAAETMATGEHILIITTADRRLHVMDAATRAVKASYSGLQDSPVLSTAIFKHQYLLTVSMSGQVVASDLSSGKIIDKRRDHNKYIVKVVIYGDAQKDEALIATAGWDNKIHIYCPNTSTSPPMLNIGAPIATIALPTKPECLLFLQHPESKKPILVFSRTDSNHIFYYTADSTPRLLGKQNLAPHSNAWVAFTPSSLAICPTDPTILAVGTNSVPHMKLLIVRMLIPPYTPTSNPAAETQLDQSRAALALADRENAAILIHATTFAPQTPYSTPTVAWRPDGSGVWVNGDDGAVRGLEARSGKVLQTLREGGHEAGSKVRCICAGMAGGKEVLVSGGFDRKVVVWDVEG
ncbi:WD40 repeat-like protein [Teratosphaeria nubilosa]|uniref:WD40 repeat-like protein n=1 Tax=Teratosphaeria nubilosa TaxID=161662 RepID=A0A6G1LBT1_9PEZI|nr:WD40 repeat-like protein [Teratosphaeria nubilosa]